jgi:HSP20 family protein
MANELDVFRGLPSDFRDLFGMSRRLNRLFDDFFVRMPDAGVAGRDTGAIVPRMEVNETEGHYVLSAELPGVPRENIEVEIRGSQLHISGERRSEVKGKEGEARREEYERYEQILALPEDVDTSNLEADYRDGVLYIAMSKRQSGQGKKVEIGSGERGVLSKLREKTSRVLGGKKEGKADKAA